MVIKSLYKVLTFFFGIYVLIPVEMCKGSLAIFKFFFLKLNFQIG